MLNCFVLVWGWFCVVAVCFVIVFVVSTWVRTGSGLVCIGLRWVAVRCFCLFKCWGLVCGWGCVVFVVFRSLRNVTTRAARDKHKTIKKDPTKSSSKRGH